MIKVLIVDDQKILSEGIRSVLETADDITVVGMAHDGEEGVSAVQTLQPDVVLLDIRMPKMNGVLATKEIKTRFPQTKVVILTTFDDSDYILDAINYGANGYLLKDINAETLIGAVRNAAKGDTILPSRIAAKVATAAKMVSSDREIKLKKAFAFSEREVEIAVMVYEGFTNRQISSALSLSEGTVRNYISSLYIKLAAPDRQAAVEKMDAAIKRG